jgi:hypothetical protein
MGSDVYGLPSRETYPDSQNLRSDGAKIRSIFESSKYFGTFFIARRFFLTKFFFISNFICIFVIKIDTEMKIEHIYELVAKEGCCCSCSDISLRYASRFYAAYTCC